MTIDLDGNSLNPDRPGRNVHGFPAEPHAFAPPQACAASKRDDCTVTFRNGREEPLGELLPADRLPVARRLSLLRQPDILRGIHRDQTIAARGLENGAE
ncbi:hypothetical protein ACQHIV_11735 [Kribbella sp. GL6]|uniref:hypothetical protein n=1 Tax=Kribbella sp. GL6 TaxID=3419765 RepID=UPI003D062760